MPTLLDEVREYMGTTLPRRGFMPGKKGYDPVLPAPWFPRHDELYEFYMKQDLLMREGEIAWGAFVQTNKFLLMPGRNDHPANVIWSTKPEIEANPEILGQIAHNLFELKTANPRDGDERRYATLLTDESSRGMGMTIPRNYAGAYHPVKSTTLMVIRRHLPTNFIVGNLVPLLTHFTTNACMLVPWKYWPRALVHQWRQIYEQTRPPQPADDRAVTLTPAALNVVQEMASRERGPWYLRLSVRKRNDQGLAEAFAVHIDDRVSRRHDYLFDQDGIRIVIDRQDIDDLEGATVDFEIRQGSRASFSFQFP